MNFSFVMLNCIENLQGCVILASRPTARYCGSAKPFGPSYPQARVGVNPIVTFEKKQLLDIMIENLV